MSGTNEDSLSSPKNRMKLLCSYGGKILPRPSDGMLKYVGGETRVVSVPRTHQYELMEKISGMFNNTDIVMKYQVMPEDLDVLVSVRSDEDLHHMLEEYDRHESLPRSPSSSSRFRVFLFPSAMLPATLRSPSYVDTVNASGSIAIPAAPNDRPTFTISNSSAGTSPTSTIDYFAGGGRPVGLGMHRVRSTPNLSGSSSQLANNITSAGTPSANHHKSRMGGSGQQSQRRNYFTPSYGAPPTGWYGCPPGHTEESYSRSRSGNSSFQFSGGQPPVAPRRNIWD
ncbi:uncharacterized protein M6B38_367975 [Iris pallida]|uniref:PB1 domain-containing protein n=1 Tax=Iris pallida TaxID=29817 RepID=A0AAX6FBT9_IRIPA|nr:uncharacterized protein M6B38_142705 [Iris pallida]KAJ6827168.1 uncharacterized protein M6B38_367975 [Iris pallida]